MDRKLKQFLAVAETGNISAAADAMAVSQPTVSVNLRLLEEDYGVPLFTRGSRGVELTEFGRVLYEHVRVMARLNEHATAELRAMKQGNRPTLKVACGFTWWDLFVRKAVQDFAQADPEAALHVDICSSYDGLRNLLSGDAVLFVGTKIANLKDPTNFKFDHLLSVEDGFFVRRDHPLVGRSIKQQDLRDFPRIDVAPIVNRHFGITETIRPIQGQSLVGDMPAQYSSNTMTSGVSILHDTDAFLIYPMVTQAYFSTQNVVMLDVSDRSSQKIEIGVYGLAEKVLNPLQRGFLDNVVSAAQSYK